MKLGKLIKEVLSLLSKAPLTETFFSRPLRAFCRYRKRTRITMQALQTSASALGSQQIISSINGLGRGQPEMFRGQIVFLSYLFIFLFYFIFFGIFLF